MMTGVFRRRRAFVAVAHSSPAQIMTHSKVKVGIVREAPVPPARPPPPPSPTRRGGG
jgi:hypothetical protein